MIQVLKTFLKRNTIILILGVFTIFFSYYNSGVRYNFFVITLFLIIGLLALYGLFFSVDKKTISVNKTFHLFYYFFFSLAPIVQYKNNTTFLLQETIADTTYILTGFTILGTSILYLLTYAFGYTYLQKKSRTVDKSTEEKPLKNSGSLLKFNYLLILLAVGCYLYVSKFNWDLFLYRPFYFDLKNNTNLGLVGYSLLYILKFIPFVVLMNYIVLGVKKNIHTLLLLFLTVLICFPSSLSRGVLAIIYIPLLVLCFPAIRKKGRYIAMYCVGILVLFPLFNAFRNLKAQGFVFKYELFSYGHFDAFQNFALLQRENIITYGEQLISSLLFFVDKEIYPGKSVGTGRLLAEHLNFEHVNISMPYIGEGYANFGYAGIIIFVIILAFINAFLDSYRGKNKVLKLYFYIFLGYEFYLLRGDLWSSMKIFISFTGAIFLVMLSNIIYRKVLALLHKNDTNT